MTLLYFDDCPSWRVASGLLDELAAEQPDIRITRRTVTTPEGAERERFRGSPSILIDGEDRFADADEPFGLSCRLYSTPAGPAGAPTIEQLRAAIQSARDQPR